MEFGYWGIKGAGEVIRLVAAYTGASITEYNPATREEWFGGKKAQIGGDFPNLPYLKDGDFVLTETGAIPLYIALKQNRPDLLGNDAKEQATVRMLEGVIGDIRQAVSKAMWTPGDKKEEFRKLFDQGGSVHTKAGYIAKFLGTKDFLVGHITLADFSFLYVCQTIAAVSASFGLTCPVCAHENIKNLCARLTALPGVKELHEKRLAVPLAPSEMVGFDLKTLKDLQSN